MKNEIPNNVGGNIRPGRFDNVLHYWMRLRSRLRKTAPFLFRKKKTPKPFVIDSRQIHSVEELDKATAKIHAVLMKQIKWARISLVVTVSMFPAIFLFCLVYTIEGKWFEALPFYVLMFINGSSFAKSLRRFEFACEEHGKFHALCDFILQQLTSEPE